MQSGSDGLGFDELNLSLVLVARTLMNDLVGLTVNGSSVSVVYFKENSQVFGRSEGGGCKYNTGWELVCVSYGYNVNTISQLVFYYTYILSILSVQRFLTGFKY